MKASLEVTQRIPKHTKKCLIIFNTDWKTLIIKMFDFSNFRLDGMKAALERLCQIEISFISVFHQKWRKIKRKHFPQDWERD